MRNKFTTNFPSGEDIQGAIRRTLKLPKGKKSRRRKGSQLIAVGMRDATAWKKRFTSPLYESKPAGGKAPPHGAGAGKGGGSHRRPFLGYRIAPLTKTEYETLRWLADRGYDAGILRAAGVQRELEDGGAILGTIPEHKAWEINDRVNEDPHAFLANCGSRGLEEKLNHFLNQIV